tara:strand:- start:150 stop:512 length:363 start_codon:yes stop_codon:yes gene_type:complete
MWDYLDKFSPALVRLLARRKTGKSKRAIVALSNQEIAIASSEPVNRIITISMMTNWEEVPVGTARRFCDACGFDPFSSADRNRASAYLRSGPTFKYLKKHPHWDTFFKPLIKHVQTAEGD